jgi:hypothetical protein
MQTQCERSSYTERNSKRRDEHQPSSRCSENRMLLHRKSRTPRRMMRRQVGTIVRCQVAGSTVVLEYMQYNILDSINELQAAAHSAPKSLASNAASALL